MPSTPNCNKLIAKISNYLLEEKDIADKDLMELFVQQYLHLLSYEDLRSQSIADTTGLIYSHWQQICKRKKNATNIRVYNPDFQTDGWSSEHTVIDISHDDMPFLVDSVRMELHRQNLGIHSIIHVGGMKVRRNSSGVITKILPWGIKDNDCDSEAPIHIQIDKHTDEKFLASLQVELVRVLNDVTSAVSDWQAMRKQISDSITKLEENPPPLSEKEISESIKFLHWIENQNFTFLGCRDYKLITSNTKKTLKMLPQSGLGVLKDTSKSLKLRHLSDMSEKVTSSMLSPEALIIAKTNTKSSIHRPAYTDYIGVKQFDEKGRLIGERRFIGLFTATAYSSSILSIPYFRLKSAKIMDASGLLKHTHARKALLNILEHLPRNDFFQASVEELKEISLQIFNLHERNKVRLFLRKDIYARYVSCYIYLPKSNYTDELRKDIQNILESYVQGSKTEYDTYFSDSTLARLHYNIRIDPNECFDYDMENIENQIVKVTTLWKDSLKKILLDFYGEEQGLMLYRKYSHSFPAGYKEHNETATAVNDIKHFEQLSTTTRMILNLYSSNDNNSGSFDFKIYQLNKPVPLSDVMPILENMGMRVMGENPYGIRIDKERIIWINDFHMTFSGDEPIRLSSVKEKFQQVFAKVWLSQLENTWYNKLALLVSFDWQQIMLLQSLSKYAKQIGVKYSQPYIAETFINNPILTKMLMELFYKRFSLSVDKNNLIHLVSLRARINKQLDLVDNLEKDTIFRLYFEFIEAIIRTNYFQENEQGFPRNYLTFKFDCSLITFLPKPKPKYEIFVYSTSFEGVHLRCGKVARGGLRWSDRQEDFRTEILGLMKAQEVKNSVIVPDGAKGGFCLKGSSKYISRDALMTAGIKAYREFICGLLELTDNRGNNKNKKPENTICYDSDDSYLVVAADKGTASFSDIANEISKKHDFWLDDAFASGGKTGYDHKKMGITARGAWISVIRHFRMHGINIEKEDVSVVGIGDMSGDVFGNGMLLSKHIILVAAFNHQDIFIDPKPNAKISHAERSRLFKLPRSSWNDYNKKLLSRGGRIYSRSAKSVTLTSQIKKLLSLKQDHIIPSDLIRAILKAKVDLLWNGGIGTYVKASNESHTDVGDRANDLLRINGNELNCRVVGEGGNLGLTQLARIEYALNNGRIYTDFIDNSAGVDCSDKEVNIKIFLNELVHNKELTIKQRNNLLKDMTDEVAALVLKDNYNQTQAIEVIKSQSTKHLDLYDRFICVLEEKKIIDRTLVSLPTSDELIERKNSNRGLTSPEIATIVSYSKIFLQKKLAASNLVYEIWFESYLFSAFPSTIIKKYSSKLAEHPLRNEIISTQLSNAIVNEMGAAFIYRMYAETGASYLKIIQAYIIARKLFSLDTIFSEIQQLDYTVDPDVQIKMMLMIVKLIRRSCRWLVTKYNNEDIILENLITQYKQHISALSRSLKVIIQGERKEYYENQYNQLVQEKVPDTLAHQIAISDVMFSSLDIIEEAEKESISTKTMATVYFNLGRQLQLSWLRYQIRAQKNETHWEGLALAGIFDDIDSIQRRLAKSVFESSEATVSAAEKIDVWLAKNSAILHRWHKLLENMKQSVSITPVMFFVSLRELNHFSDLCSVN